MRIEWNPQKAAGNIRKHGVSFLEAASVFYDPLSATAGDPDHSMVERRPITFGMSAAGRILVVSHVDREDTIRIITARPATRKEGNLYEKG